jgi:hypothetical protein
MLPFRAARLRPRQNGNHSRIRFLVLKCVLLDRHQVADVDAVEGPLHPLELARDIEALIDALGRDTIQGSRSHYSFNIGRQLTGYGLTAA